MSLYVVATPIGNPKDLTLRAVDVLKRADIVIGEEQKPTCRLLKFVGCETDKEIFLLNEHSTPHEVNQLAELCLAKEVALVSDAGTPGFCDPGADLVARCRTLGVKVTALPGPSSLMALLSISGVRLNNFTFIGFLPQKKEERMEKLLEMSGSPRPKGKAPGTKRDSTVTSKHYVFMDTPYRLRAVLDDIAATLPSAHCVLGGDLTGEKEFVLEGRAADIRERLPAPKAPFVLLVTVTG